MKRQEGRLASNYGGGLGCVCWGGRQAGEICPVSSSPPGPLFQPRLFSEFGVAIAEQALLRWLSQNRISQPETRGRWRKESLFAFPSFLNLPAKPLSGG